MRKPILLPSLLLGASLLSGAAFVLPSIAGDGRPAPHEAERQWLPIGDVSRKLEAAGYRNIEKIEREHGVYEARATDRSGARVKLRIHPQSGEISERGEHGERHDGARRSGRDGASSADCNKRRCRDDLPVTAPATSAPAIR